MEGGQADRCGSGSSRSGRGHRAVVAVGLRTRSIRRRRKLNRRLPPVPAVTAKASAAGRADLRHRHRHRAGLSVGAGARARRWHADAVSRARGPGGQAGRPDRGDRSAAVPGGAGSGQGQEGAGRGAARQRAARPGALSDRWRRRISPRASRSIRSRRWSISWSPPSRATMPRSRRRNSMWILLHHVAGRWPGRIAAGRSRQPDPCDRYDRHRHDHADPSDLRHLHAAAGGAAARRRQTWRSGSAGAGLCQRRSHRAGPGNAADAGQHDRHHHRHDPAEGDISQSRRTSCGRASSSTRICRSAWRATR